MHYLLTFLPVSSFDLKLDVSVEFIDSELGKLGAIVIQKYFRRGVCVELLETILVILKEHGLDLG